MEYSAHMDYYCDVEIGYKSATQISIVRKNINRIYKFD